MKPLHLLIVDDSPTNQEATCLYLAQLGHTADTASNGKEAITALKAKKYDAILMDYQMPVMNGLETTQYIRTQKDPSIPQDIPIIAFTADADPSHKEFLLTQGMNGLITKPFTENDLHVALHEIGSTHTPVEYPPEIIQLFISEVEEHLENIRMGVKFIDRERIHRAIHTIKGTAANFNATAIIDMAHKIKEVLDNNEVLLNRYQQEILELLPKIRDNLQTFKEKLPKNTLNT